MTAIRRETTEPLWFDYNLIVKSKNVCCKKLQHEYNYCQPLQVILHTHMPAATDDNGWLPHLVTK